MCFNGLCIAKYYDKEMPRPVSMFLKSHHQVALGRVIDSWAPKWQGRIRSRFGSHNIFSHFFVDPLKKDGASLLVINSSQMVRIISHFDGEYLQKIIEVSLCSYLSNISWKYTIFRKYFKLNLYWSERAFNSASFLIRTTILSLEINHEKYSFFTGAWFDVSQALLYTIRWSKERATKWCIIYCISTWATISKVYMKCSGV
jgi:hypothetical protein